MSELTNAFMARFVEFINSADASLGAALVAPDAVFHVPHQSEPLQGLVGFMAVIGMMRAGFPDIQWTLEESIAEGDKIAARFTMRGTHQGSFLGVPPSGRPIAVQAMNFYRLVDGRIAEERGQPDLMGVMQQIGALPGG